MKKYLQSKELVMRHSMGEYNAHFINQGICHMDLVVTAHLFKCLLFFMFNSDFIRFTFSEPAP